jgi:hypothetical protein
MVDTPKNGGEGGGHPKHRRRVHHNGGTCNGDTSNDDATNGDAAKYGTDNGGAGNNNGNDMINGDDDDPNDGDYIPKAEEEASLSPDEYDAFEEPLEGPQLETLRK